MLVFSPNLERPFCTDRSVIAIERSVRFPMWISIYGWRAYLINYALSTLLFLELHQFSVRRWQAQIHILLRPHNHTARPSRASPVPWCSSL